MAVENTARTRPLLVAAAGAVAVLVAVPLIYVAVRIAEAGPDGILLALTRPRLPMLVGNTLLLAVTVTVAATVLGVATALVLTRVRLPAAPWLALIAVLPLAIPSYLAAFGLLAAAPGISGFWPAWAVLTAVTTPYVTLPVAAALRGTPSTQVEVAATLGYRPVRAFRSAMLPGIRVPAAAGALLVCLYVLADFGGVALFRFPVLTTAIQQAYGAAFNRNDAALFAGVLVLMALVVFGVDRGLRPARDATVGRHDPAAAARWGPYTPFAVAVITLPAVVAVVVPLTSLLVRLVNARTVAALDPARLVEATAGTLSLAVGGAVLAVVLALPIAALAARRPGRLSSTFETVGSLPLALPGIVVGLGLVFFSLVAAPALYQTAAVLVFAYGILLLPKTLGTVRSSLARVPRDLEDVASTLGYGPAARWWRVTVRLSRPGIVIAAVFAAISAMKELPATLMLRPTGTTTLAIELWNRTDVAAYGAAVPYALALVVVAALPAALLSPHRDRLSAARRP